jgi:hypothetical protein
MRLPGFPNIIFLLLSISDLGMEAFAVDGADPAFFADFADFAGAAFGAFADRAASKPTLISGELNFNVAPELV